MRILAIFSVASYHLTWQSQLFCSTKVGQRTSSESRVHCEIAGAAGYGATPIRKTAAAARCHEGDGGLGAAVEPVLRLRRRLLRLFRCDDKHRGLRNLNGTARRFDSTE